MTPLAIFLFPLQTNIVTMTYSGSNCKVVNYKVEDKAPLQRMFSLECSPPTPFHLITGSGIMFLSNQIKYKQLHAFSDICRGRERERCFLKINIKKYIVLEMWNFHMFVQHGLVGWIILVQRVVKFNHRGHHHCPR